MIAAMVGTEITFPNTGSGTAERTDQWSGKCNYQYTRKCRSAGTVKPLGEVAKVNVVERGKFWAGGITDNGITDNGWTDRHEY